MKVIKTMMLGIALASSVINAIEFTGERPSELGGNTAALNVNNQLLSTFTLVSTNNRIVLQSLFMGRVAGASGTNLLPAVSNVSIKHLDTGAIVAGPIDALVMKDGTQSFLFTDAFISSTGINRFGIFGKFASEFGNGITMEIYANPGTWFVVDALGGNQVQMGNRWVDLQTVTTVAGELAIEMPKSVENILPGTRKRFENFVQVSAVDSGEDVGMSIIAITIEGSASKDIHGITFLRDGVSLNTGSNILNPTGPGRYVVQLDNMARISKGTAQTWAIEFTTDNDASGQITFGFPDVNQSLAVGLASGNAVKPIYKGVNSFIVLNSGEEGTVENARITLVERNPGERIVLTADGTPGRLYVVESSTDLKHWYPHLDIGAFATIEGFLRIEFAMDWEDQRFYRFAPIRQLVVTLDSSTPQDQKVAADSAGVTASAIRFNASLLQDLQLVAVSLKITDKAAAQALVGNQVRLWDGSVEVGRGIFISDRFTTIYLSTPVYIPAGTSKVLRAKVDIASIDPFGPAIEGQTFAINLDDEHRAETYAVGMDDGKTVTAYGLTQSGTITITR